LKGDKILAAKEKMIKIIQDQAEDSSCDESLRKLAFSRMIERSLKDSRAGNIFSNEEMKHRIQTL
jgi:hypothetical protein